MYKIYVCMCTCNEKQFKTYELKLDIIIRTINIKVPKILIVFSTQSA